MTKEKEMSFLNRYSKNHTNHTWPVAMGVIFKLVLFLLLLPLSMELSSQNIVQLHPVVGDTISNSEKVAFYLFPEISDSGFIQGVIFFQDSTFNVNIIEREKDNYIAAIDSTMLQEYNHNIEKLIQYYSKLEESDSLQQKQLLLSNTSSAQSGPEYKLNAEDRKQLVKESKRYLRKKDKAEDMGLWGVDKENYIKGASNTNILKAKIRL